MILTAALDGYMN